MKNYNFDQNKILYSTNLFKWMSFFSHQKETQVISPLTKISDLFDFKKGSPLFDEVLNYKDEGVEKYLSIDALSDFVEEFNRNIGEDIIDFDLSSDKIIKTLFTIKENGVLTSKIINAYLSFVNKHATKMQTLIIVGFDNEISRENLNMVNVHILTNNLKIVKWHLLEELVLLDYENIHEIIEKERFKSWLELKTRTVLSIKDIEAYFSGEINYNTFMIEKALQELK